MKGIILYYSTTGNTELVCKYISNKFENVDICCHDIKTNSILDLSSYDIVGFATFTDWWDIPYAFEKFIDNLQTQEGKPAFVLNTYAHISGRTLKTLAKKVEKKGFVILAGHSVRMPGNYPPSIAIGRVFESAPEYSDLNALRRFISRLSEVIVSNTACHNKTSNKVRIGVINSILRRYPRIYSKRKMGQIFVDESLCKYCGRCQKQCAYQAIELTPLPTFDNDKCYGCWSCFNNCPQKAIYTDKVRGIGHYSFPNISLD